MNIEIGHVLIDASIKSFMIIGSLLLLTGFPLRRRISANERLTVLSAGVCALLVLTITNLIAGAFGLQSFLSLAVLIKPDYSELTLVIIQAVWLAIALPLSLLTMLRIVIGEWQCISKRGRIVDVKCLPQGIQLKRPVILSEDCFFPCVKGVLFQRVFLPPEFFDWSVEDQRNILLHEGFHLRRFDILWKCIADFGSAIYWFNPLVWYARSCIGLEQEISCDNGVLTMGVNGAQYSETILLVAQGRRKNVLAANIGISGHLKANCFSDSFLQFRTMMIIQAWTRKTQLRRRVLSIIDPTICRRSLGLLAHAILFLAVTWFSSCIFYFSLFQRYPTAFNIVRFERVIDSTIDDAEEKISTGSVSLDSSDLEFCMDYGQNRPQMIGLRFPNVELPANARIVSAKIIFMADVRRVSDEQKGLVESEIFVQLAPNPKPFSRSTRNVSERFSDDQRSISWKIDKPWIDKQCDYQTSSPELKDLLQQLISDTEWKSGDAIVFIVNSKQFDYSRSAAAFDNVRSLAPPKLCLLYTTGE